MNKFTHLHTHSDASLLDGTQSVTQIAKKAARLGMESVALTDHGRCGNLLKFKKACEKAEVRPIYGCEFYVSPKSRLIKESIEGHKPTYHLTVLAKNETGLRNIFKLCSTGWLDGFYYRPRIDDDLLCSPELSEGLVVLSGCAASRTSYMLLEGRQNEAEGYLKRLHKVFKDDFYIEVQNHGFDWQRPLKEQLFYLSNKLDVPIVATQDSHYPNREDAKLHRTVYKMTAGNLTFEGDDLFFKSEEEMLQMFEPNEYHAVYRTKEVADKCRCNWQFGKTIWPVLKLPDTPENILRQKTREGFKKLFNKDMPRYQEYVDRAKYELGVIEKMGFPTYFLIVQDFISWARKNKIAVGPARGSVSGSLVAYCIGITEINPIKYNLIFERFLSPGRAPKPTINFVEFTKEQFDMLKNP